MPFFVINDKVALSGAREVSAFLEAFDRAESGGSVAKIGLGK